MVAADAAFDDGLALVLADLLAVTACEVDGVVDTETDQEDRDDLEDLGEVPDDAKVLGSEDHTDPVHPEDRQHDDQHRQPDVCGGTAGGAEARHAALGRDPEHEAEDDHDDEEGGSEETPDLSLELVLVGEQQRKAERRRIHTGDLRLGDLRLHVDLSRLQLHLIGVIRDQRGVDQHDHQASRRGGDAQVGGFRGECDRELTLELGWQGVESGSIERLGVGVRECCRVDALLLEGEEGRIVEALNAAALALNEQGPDLAGVDRLDDGQVGTERVGSEDVIAVVPEHDLDRGDRRGVEPVGDDLARQELRRVRRKALVA